MRHATIIMLAMFVLVPAAFARNEDKPAGKAPEPAGVLSIDEGVGVFVIKGEGALIGRLARGTVVIQDLSPVDRWGWTVNGLRLTRQRAISGDNITFRLLGGRYRIVVRGQGLSVSARGKGIAHMDGDPGDASGAGVYAVGEVMDCRTQRESCMLIPDEKERIRFGPNILKAEAMRSSDDDAQSGKGKAEEEKKGT